MTNPLYLYDRSRVTCDWSCPRKRYWQYQFKGKGVVSDNLSLELFMGSSIHDALAGIASGGGIDDLATAAQKSVFTTLMGASKGEAEYEALTFADEQSALVEGMVRGFYRQVWPRLMASYPIILFVEEEMTYEHDGMVFMSKPDLVLQSNEGRTVYVEYKSTSSKKDSWVNSWNTAVQLHSTIRAVEATKGVKVDEVLVQGLYKGYESYNKQNSPFCYAYHRYGNPPFSPAETLYEYKAGYKRIPTWELEGGVRKWVEEMPNHILQDQFPCSPPIYIKEDLVDAFFRQRAFREAEIRLAMQMLEVADGEAKEDILNVTFPQKFEQCTPYFGRPCSYSQLCFGSVEDPLQQGYMWREPHHALEMEEQNAEV